MATHQDYKKFAVKYNKEFKIAGVHKMKKAELINAIEKRLYKSRTEIIDEYNKLKNMVKEKKTRKKKVETNNETDIFSFLDDEPKPKPKKKAAPKPKPKPKPKPTPKPKAKAKPKQQKN